MEEPTVDRRSLTRELDAVKKALLLILQEENPLPALEQQAREDELSRRLTSQGSSSPSHAIDSQDLSILSRLLHQVKVLEQEDGGMMPARLENSEKSGCYNGCLSTEKRMVETVVQIASVAAEAAKAAASSSRKNLEVVETLLSSSEKTTQHRLTHSASHDKEKNAKASSDKFTRRSFSAKDFVKTLERQNRITHCVLGFMIVATAIWRFKLLSMFMGVRRSFSNPFQLLGDMVTEGFKGSSNKEEQNGGNGFRKARVVLPSILGGEEKEAPKKVERKEHTHEDFRIGDALTLSLDNILSVGKSSNGSDKEDNAKRD